MYTIDDDKFSRKTSHACTNSSFILCKTSCCNKYFIKDVELTLFYIDPNNLNTIIDISHDSPCFFCNSQSFDYLQIQDYADISEPDNIWHEYFIDDLSVADVVLKKENKKTFFLLSFLIKYFVGFAWDLRNSLFKDDSTKEISIHGVFSEFSTYFKTNFQSFSEDNLSILFDQIETSLEYEDDIYNAICTCFLENIAGEGYTSKLKNYLGKKSLDYYQRWDR
jgi:hypothetical protein